MTNQTTYFGPEQRIEQRRKIVDRRELIRFEPDREPRRRGHGRRKGEMNDPWNRLDISEKEI
ncbi:MAG: hypothetical protein KZQ73_05695 [Candidatus Thiodiazotropha sp. (ex Semelilucina semeliformis)]|nr:hypothetical protein [Candidatus Thiodiazotropha sp. (ex Myrtea spinifera)]MCU7807347.1 hypothetical protein [Candidatus Thiodiazotropha sp. (ex Semelilucina semeliformis)]MCU7830352.1 hypothetical protein [Candidatus Thiodiazotropha sp. (ex Myrtea sp. 'scaly one' KF741663)]